MRDTLDPSTLWAQDLAAQVPRLWRGAGRDVPLVALAMRDLDAAYDTLCRLAGHRQVHVATTSPRMAGKLGFDGAPWASWAEAPMRLEQLIEDLRAERRRPSGTCPYMQSAPVQQALPELAPLMRVTALDHPAAPDAALQLWMGSGGQRVAIHQDASHGLMFVASGTKHVWVCPPEELGNLYPAPIHQLVGEPWRSRVDPREPDLVRFPRFAKARARARWLSVEPGDVLLLPAYWWHAVDSEGPSVMFNLRWHDLEHAQVEGIVGSLAHAVAVAGRLDADERARAREVTRHAVEASRGLALSRRLEERPSGPAWPLSWSAEVTVAPRPQGLYVCAPDGHTSISWDHVPVLSYLTGAASEAAIVSSLLAAFELDADIAARLVADTLAALTAIGALCADSWILAGDAAGAVAHVGAVAAGLPAHHRHQLVRLVAHFAWRESGPPFGELPAAEQGLLGIAPDLASRRALEVAALRSVRTLLARDASWRRPLVLGDCVSGALGTGGARFASVARPSATLRHEHLELLACFATPTTPAAAHDDLVGRAEVSEAQLRTLVEAWLAAGILVPADVEYRAAHSQRG